MELITRLNLAELYFIGLGVPALVCLTIGGLYTIIAEHCEEVIKRK